MITNMGLKDFKIYSKELRELPTHKMLINTINAYSYVMSHKDSLFKEALSKGDVLIPDGISIVWAIRWLTGKKIKKIAGADLFVYQMDRLQKSGGKCFFLGSNQETLKKIKEKAKNQYPQVQVETYSPPYKENFTCEDNQKIIQKINAFNAEVVFVGMTAPKQEKWAYTNYTKINQGHICSIGAVFDFYAGNIKRAPQWAIKWGLEWLYRFLKEPKRLWKRYMIGNSKFIYYILVEKIRS